MDVAPAQQPMAVLMARIWQPALRAKVQLVVRRAPSSHDAS
jgi:hypothetical protein